MSQSEARTESDVQPSPQASSSSQSSACRVAVGYLGCEPEPDLHALTTKVREVGHEFVAVPISRRCFERRASSTSNADKDALETRAAHDWRQRRAFSSDDLVLKTADWSDFAVGLASDWIDLDSTDRQAAINSELALKQELSWASHLGLSAVILPQPGERCVNYARYVHEVLAGLNYTQLWVRMPLVDETLSDDEASETATWEQWNKMRTIADHNIKLSLALELTADLPSTKKLERWIAEPIRLLIVPTHLFMTNSNGYHVLSKRHQMVVRRLMKLRVNIVIHDTSNHLQDPDGRLVEFLDYIRHLNRTLPALTEIEKFTSGYQDYLQSPLQVIMVSTSDG